MEGGVDDLADLCENIALSERTLTAGLARLEDAVRDISHRLRTTVPQGVLDQMAAELRQEDGEQTSRMAAAIILNAATFHTAVSGRHDIKTLDQLRDQHRKLRKKSVLDCWHYIITQVNYWPIFYIALQLVKPLPPAAADQILERTAAAAGELAGIGVTTMHDLAGRMFQQLIADRKFLATFYTLPPSAAMIAELAAAKLDLDWANSSSVTELRVADLACGTGTLLSAAYQAVRSRYRRAGGDDADIHPQMMESCLIAADVLPQAAHLTASMLSSAHPSIPFGNTRVYTMGYGRSDAAADDMALGSLDLLDDRGVETLFAVGEEMAHGAGTQERSNELLLQHGSAHLVIMNPPFTRPTNHETADVPLPNFAGLDNDEQAQRLMGKKLRKLRLGLEHPVGNGYAGLGSDFADLANVKLKEGGVLALVLPFTVIAGRSWRKLRELLSAHYQNTAVISIAGIGSTERAFSADTGMADTVIIAVKAAGKGDDQTLYVNLARRPESLPEAAETARLISKVNLDEQYGYLALGDDFVGVWLRGSLNRDGGMAALSQPGAAATMVELPKGRLVLPRTGRPLRLPMTILDRVGREGLVHRLIGAKPAAQGVSARGPFEIHPISGVPEYPVLWAHSAPRERRLVVEPDSQGRVRRGLASKALEIWKRTASALHFNLDFRLNSQSLAACYTPEPVIGGRAWPSIEPHQERWAIPILLWANTTLGLMCFWWTGARQQQGRACLTITTLPDLPVLDPRCLDHGQLDRAERIFDDFRGRELLPANEAYRDQARQALDRAVLIDLLGLPEDILDPLDVLRRQWCSEPSVHGGKSTRPA